MHVYEGQWCDLEKNPEQLNNVKSNTIVLEYFKYLPYGKRKCFFP